MARAQLLALQDDLLSQSGPSFHLWADPQELVQLLELAHRIVTLRGQRRDPRRCLLRLLIELLLQAALAPTLQ